MKQTFTILTAFVCQICLAQTCPATMGGKVEVETKGGAWESHSKRESFKLRSISIVDGPISDDPAEPDAELVPLEKGDIQYWAFGEELGPREVWMICEGRATVVEYN